MNLGKTGEIESYDSKVRSDYRRTQYLGVKEFNFLLMKRNNLKLKD